MSTVWIVSGMSGAGKATALSALEAAGVECVDGLRPELAAAFAALPRPRAAAAVIDARHGEFPPGFAGVPGTRLLFLDARDEVLVRRNADSSRPHPCADHGRGPAAIAAERDRLGPIRAAADVVLDTSDLDVARFCQRVVAVVLDGAPAANTGLVCTVTSFGFKYGPQLEGDWVIDVRFLRNPFWEPDLRPLTGNDPAVRAYVLQGDESRYFVDHVTELLAWTIARAEVHGRRALHVALGCTGGRHRSVVVATELAARLESRGVTVRLRHRDVDRPDPR